VGGTLSRTAVKCLSLSKTRTSSGLSSVAHVLPVSFVRSRSSIGEGDARNKSRMTSNGACFRLSLANPLDNLPNLYPKNLLILSQTAAPELRQDHHLSIAGSRRSASLWHRRYCSSRRSSETASIRMSRPPWTAPGPASAIDYQTTCLPSCRP